MGLLYLSWLTLTILLDAPSVEPTALKVCDLYDPTLGSRKMDRLLEHFTPESIQLIQHLPPLSAPHADRLC